MSGARPALERLTTGSAAFDRILGGGIPARSVNVIAGQPGSGKTLFSLQMLFALARQGKRCVYLTTLAEPSLKLLQYMQQFDFFDEALLESQIVFADLGSVIRRKGVDATLGEIANRVEREAPAVVVIDSFKAIRDILSDPATLRTFVYDLAVHTASWGATTLLVGEYTEAEIAGNAELAIADGIIRFSNARHELTAVREVEVMKLRGADYATGGHFCEISSAGVAFFPRVRGPDGVALQASAKGVRPVASLEPVSTGVAGLDAMLGGGWPRASTTVVQGGTGTGKTLLGLQFLLAGARRGEAGILFLLEETPAQIRGFAQSLGWDLCSLEDRGLLTLSYCSPVGLSPDRFLDRARADVERLAVRHAVLDSLTSMALGVPSERRFKELVYALSKDFHSRGISLQMNMEVADLLGAGQLSGHGVSFAADNVVQLKYVEIDGHLQRGISVLKARGVKHATDVRRLSVEQGGVQVGVSFQGMRGVLTGLPLPLQVPQ
ncbi:MAG TPA: ATPase domain-containing protein [Polyangiaceae bacterium]|nr:ATPase domain-containing protein [Polyangiaceae bacterium]